MYDVREKVVRAFISHQFGLGSNPDVDIKCGLSLLLVLSLASLLKKQYNNAFPIIIPIQSGTQRYI